MDIRKTAQKSSENRIGAYFVVLGGIVPLLVLCTDVGPMETGKGKSKEACYLLNKVLQYPVTYWSFKDDVRKDDCPVCRLYLSGGRPGLNPWVGEESTRCFVRVRSWIFYRHTWTLPAGFPSIFMPSLNPNHS